MNKYLIGVLKNKMDVSREFTRVCKIGMANKNYQFLEQGRLNHSGLFFMNATM